MHAVVYRLRRTVGLFLDLEGDGFSCHLQQVYGFTERLPLQTDAVDGQNTIADVNGSSPVRTDNKHTMILLILRTITFLKQTSRINTRDAKKNNCAFL